MGPNINSLVNLGNYKTPEYNITSKPAGSMTDVRINKKEEAKPKHWILFTAATLAAIGIVAYKIGGKFDGFSE